MIKLKKDQPFWASVILHLVVLIALFLATIVEFFKPKEELHVFEMVESPSVSQMASAPAPSPRMPPVPDKPTPELPPVPELAAVPEPVVPTPQPTPRPAPTKPKLTTIDDFIRQHGAPQPRQTTRTTTPRVAVSVPTIDVPRLVVPTNTSSNASSPRPLSSQQISELGKYSARLRAKIDAAWGKPANLAGARVAATVIFNVSASGRITNARLQPSSGNSTFDQSVLAAFRRAVSAGPTPTGQAHVFTMTFRMSD